MDTYIDKYETLGYGDFAAAQLVALVKGLDPDFDKPVEKMAKRLAAATEAMRAALKKSGDVEVTTYAGAAGDGDPVASARDVLKRAVRYAESRPQGDAVASAMLQGETLGTVLRRRPAKLIASLDHAIGAVEQHKKKLPEHQHWAAELTQARDALDKLDKAVRKSRVERRAMTPEVQAARAEWLKVYGAAKLLAECVLRLADKAQHMPEVFDDLAEVHRVAGVTDDHASPAQP
jgi:hypothetical protein